MEDYAIALVDELEKPQHRRQRFSVGYQWVDSSSLINIFNGVLQ